jgi:hypothetical protein
VQKKIYLGKYFSKAYPELNGTMHAFCGVWRWVTPPKEEFLVWFFMQEKLNTWRKLRRLNIIRDSSKAFSPFYSLNEEVRLSFIFTLQV